MTDIMFPPLARVSRSKWDVVSNTAAARSIFTGGVKTLARTGDRFRVSLTTLSASNGESNAVRANLKSFRSFMSGQANRVWFGDASNPIRGSFPCAEMLANNYFANGSTGWTAGSGWTVNVSNGFAKLTATSATPATTALYQGITLTNGIAYAVRSLSVAGFGTTQPGAVLGSINNASGTPGMYVAYGTAGSTGSQNVGVYHTIPGGFASGRTFYVPWVSCQRCALVAGASQTGSILTIDALPISTNGLALPGDIVQIITSVGTQLVMLTMPLDSDSSGTGYLHFKPTLRGSPADNSPVIFGYPVGKFVSTENEGGWTDSPGGFSDIDFEFEEALDG